MMSPRVFSSLFVLLACMVWPSVQVCAPDCAGVDPGTLVKDPTDCTRYYVCLMINGIMIASEEPIECDAGEYFSEDHQVPRCDPIDIAPPGFCSNLCNPCVPNCRLDNPGTVQPHPLNCGNYFVCLNGAHTLEEECPVESPYFDFKMGNCQMDETLCYDYCDICVPHCTIDGERIADPMDCHRFYLCSPPDTASFLCPNGGVFDPESGECDTNAICNTLCPNTSGWEEDEID